MRICDGSAVIETVFQAQPPDGRLRKVIVRIGQPVQAKTLDWVCLVQMIGLQKRMHVRGEDALQAMCIAIQLVGDTPYQFRKNGGRLKYGTSKQAVPLHAYFRIKALQKGMEKLEKKMARA